MNFHPFALRRDAFLTTSMALLLVLAACAPAEEASQPAASDGTSGGGTVAVTDGAVAISADNSEFDANTIEAPAGEAFTVTFTNNEGAQHNWALYREEGGEQIVIGEIIGEGATDEVEVPALEPGEYFFKCDVHPDMNGTVVVEG